MEYICHNMNAYNLHIIKTDKFKTITKDGVIDLTTSNKNIIIL